MPMYVYIFVGVNLLISCQKLVRKKACTVQKTGDEVLQSGAHLQAYSRNFTQCKKILYQTLWKKLQALFEI